MRRKIKSIYPIDLLKKWIEVDMLKQSECAELMFVKTKQISKLVSRYKIKGQRTGPRSAEGHPEWKGGRLVDKHGYILVYCSGHPYARKPRMKYVYEHRLVMEKLLKRYLLPNEIVHHKNGIKDDNRIENLEIYSSNSEHLRSELTGKVPKWSDEGKLRLRLVVEKRADMYRKRPKDRVTTKERRSIHF